MAGEREQVMHQFATAPGFGVRDGARERARFTRCKSRKQIRCPVVSQSGTRIAAIPAAHLPWNMMLPAAALTLALALSSANGKAVDGVVRGVMSGSNIAGMSVGIALGDRTLYLKAFGMRDVAARLPAEPGTVYEIGSLTKQFTAAALLLAQSDGSVDLQAPLSRYVPEYPAAAAVSIRELLDQTSGIPDYSAAPDFAQWMNRVQAPEELVARVSKTPLHFAPGSQFEYSNTNYVLLGMVLERTTHVAYADFLAARIFAPLGLRSTAYGPQAREARGYAWRAGTFVPEELETMNALFSAGALSSNVPDLLAWQAQLLQSRGLPPRVTQAMLQDGGYGFGLQHRQIYGRDVAEHAALIPGFSGYAGILPQTRLHIVLLANTATDLAPLAKSIIGIVAPAVDGGEDPAVTARVVAASAQALGAFGAPLSFTFAGRDGGTVRYRIVFQGATVVATFALRGAAAVLLHDELAP